MARIRQNETVNEPTQVAYDENNLVSHSQAELERHIPRQDFPGSRKPGAKTAAAKYSGAVDPSLAKEMVESAAKHLLGGDPNEVRSVPPVTVHTKDGFKNQLAQDIFEQSTNQDKAKLADELINILGAELYKEVKHLANCCGINDESRWLRMHLGEFHGTEELEDCFNAALRKSNGDLSPFEQAGFEIEQRREHDDNANSAINSTLRGLIKDSNLGVLRSFARINDISNVTALRAVVLEMMPKLRSRGFGGKYEKSTQATTVNVGMTELFNMFKEMTQMFKEAIAQKKADA